MIEECLHPQRQICKKPTQAGAMWFWDQCLTCGDHVRVKKQSGIVPDYDKTIRDKWWAAKNEDNRAYWEQKEAEKKRERDEENARWWRWYNNYLQSPGWRVRRRKVLARANHQCEACLEARATEVHHLTYDHAGDEPLFDLVAICALCHDSITIQDRARRDAR